MLGVVDIVVAKMVLKPLDNYDGMMYDSSMGESQIFVFDQIGLNIGLHKRIITQN